METDMRAELAERLWPDDPGARSALTRLVDAGDARRLALIVRLLAADSAAVAALRRFRWESRRSGDATAFADLRAGLRERYRRGVPRALFGDPGVMADPRIGARILVSVFRRRRRGLEVADPVRTAAPSSGAIVAAVREVVDADDSVSGRTCLVHALGDPDWHVRAGAVRLALGFLGHQQVRRALARSVWDEVAPVRALVVRGLGRRAGLGQVDALLRDALVDPDAAVRRRAAEACAGSAALSAEIGLMAFDPDAGVRAAVLRLVGDGAVREAVDRAAGDVEAGRDVPAGILRVIVREAGLDRARVDRILRRRIVRLVRAGQSRPLVDTARALAWLPDASPSLRRLSRYIMAAPGMDRPCFALLRSWPADLVFPVGLSRLRHPGDDGDSLRVLLVEALVHLAAVSRDRRDRVMVAGLSADAVTASGIVFEAAKRFPADEVEGYLPAYEARADRHVDRTCAQVRARLSGRA